MGIFTRFRDIVSSNINAMLDSAEDPEKMIKLMIREMEDTLIEIKSSCAGVLAGRKKVQRRLDNIAERVNVWSDRAKLAVAKGRDNLAREALIEKRRFSELTETIKNEITDFSGLIKQYQDDIGELEGKLTSAKKKKGNLVQRHKKARNKKRAQEDIRNMDSGDTMARFEHLESRIDRMEAEADMVNFAKKQTIDDQFEDLVSDDDIENELAKMKKASSFDSDKSDS